MLIWDSIAFAWTRMKSTSSNKRMTSPKNMHTEEYEANNWFCLGRWWVQQIQTDILMHISSISRTRTETMVITHHFGSKTHFISIYIVIQVVWVEVRTNSTEPTVKFFHQTIVLLRTWLSHLSQVHKVSLSEKINWCCPYHRVVQNHDYHSSFRVQNTFGKHRGIQFVWTKDNLKRANRKHWELFHRI